MQQNEKIDLLIVGSGAAASIIAAKASMAGKKVVMLEAGPKRSMQDLKSSQIWARKLKWGGAFVEESGNHKVGNGFNNGWGTGGSAMHHYGVWPRFHEVDFNQHSLFGEGLDWPINYDDLRPYYDRVQAELGISGDAKQEKWRPPGDPYPMPAVPLLAQGQAIATGFNALDRHTAPIPLAINTRPKGKRAACIYDGWCDAGCPTGALANPLSHYLPIALEADAEIIHQANVSRVITNNEGNKAIGVEYFDKDGKALTLMASAVVLAANPIQNPRLMLTSANRKHPQGLCNRNDQVGRYLMTHPTKTVGGLFKQRTDPYLGVTGGQLINQDHYDDKTAIKGAFGGFQWLIANAVKPNDLLGIANSRPDIRGKKLDEFMLRAANHYATMVYVADDIPLAENRVTLSTNKDSFGTPLASAAHSIKAETQALIDFADADGLNIFKHAGAEESWIGPLAGMHIMGGTIMGKSVEQSVTNEFGQTHEIDNLLIAGCGLFPSSGAVNPTFTLHALALKSVEFILDEWSALKA